MRAGVCVVAALVAWTVALPAAAQSPVRATLTGRSHFQWNTTSVDDGATPVPWSTFETRRVRLAAEVQVGDWIRGRIEPEFTMGELRLRQAWMSFMFDTAFVVRAGQMKKPFGAINLASSSQLAVIERGVRIRGLDGAVEQHTLIDDMAYTGYDQGLMVEGERGAFAWAAGVFNGTGADARDQNDGKSFAGRLTAALPFAKELRIGAALSHRELNWPGALSSTTRSGNAFALDAELGGFRSGAWIIGEVTFGENLVTQERFAGAQVIASYFSPTGAARVEGIEPVARVSWADPDDAVDGDGGVLLTPGFNLYFAGRNRFMMNWDVYMPQADGADTQHALRAQFNLHF